MYLLTEVFPSLASRQCVWIHSEIGVEDLSSGRQRLSCEDIDPNALAPSGVQQRFVSDVRCTRVVHHAICRITATHQRKAAYDGAKKMLVESQTDVYVRAKAVSAVH